MSNNTGLYALCENKKDLSQSDTRHRVECCMSYCLHPKNCKSLCDKVTNDTKSLASCIASCDEQSLMCLDMCGAGALMTVELNPYLECVSKTGCRVLDQVNKQCIEKKKNDITKCCLNNCLNTDIQNCNDHCEFAYDMLEKYLEIEEDADIKRGKYIDETKRNKKKSETYQEFIVVLIFLAIILVYIILKK